MSNRSGKGIPTRKTVGALGDIYTDTTTGKQYKCIFAYRSDNDEEFDCQWKELSSGDAKKSEVEKVKKVEKVEEVEKVEKVEKEEKVEEETVEKPVEVEEEQPKRTNYSAYSKKSK